MNAPPAGDNRGQEEIGGVKQFCLLEVTLSSMKSLCDMQREH
jgi:hypothetical protein